MEVVPFRSGKVKLLWSPRRGVSSNWRMFSKPGEVVPLYSVTEDQIEAAKQELLSDPPDSLFNCTLNRFAAIISDTSHNLWRLVGEHAVRECCYPKLGYAGTIVPGSVASVSLGKTICTIGPVRREIDLSEYVWHLVLDEDKLAEWFELYGPSKESLHPTEQVW